jgi:ketopantoate hydroxymethyltransferase
MYDDMTPRFVRKYMDYNNDVYNAVERFSKDVRSGNYPNKKESYE